MVYRSALKVRKRCPAGEVCEEAIRLRPTSSGAMSDNYTFRAEAYRMLGQPQRAIETWRRPSSEAEGCQRLPLPSPLLHYAGGWMRRKEDLGTAVELGVDRAALVEEIKKLKEER